MLLVYINAPTRETAAQIGRALIQEKLAAAANIFSVDSIYVWQDNVCEEQEWTLIVKTRQECYARIVQRVLQLHPWEVPAITAIEPKEASKDYIEWVLANTSEEVPEMP